MSSIILSSAENSALLQTLSQSDSMVIPSVYSTKEIYAPSATSWFSGLDPQSTNVTEGSSVTWTLPKFGFLQQILFSFRMEYTAGAVLPAETISIPAGSAYEMIDRIEFLSSSRVISTLYKQDLIALHSNLATDELFPITQTFATETNDSAPGVGEGGSTVSIGQNYVLPIVFGFNEDINTVQNLSFNEPCQLRIVWGSTFDLAARVTTDGGATAASLATAVCSKPQLALRYKMYSEADNAMLLSENYSEPQLNMLTSRQYRENPVRETAAASKVKFDNVSLKNVDVVKAFYVMVRPVTVNGSTGTNKNQIAQNQKITSVKLMASGQEICTISEQQNFYSKLTDNGYAFQSSTALLAGVGYSNVFKIQTGLWENGGGGAWSNGWSLREMNNLTITVEADTLKATGQYELTVVETTSTILSTSSNTGRVTTALSN